MAFDEGPVDDVVEQGVDVFVPHLGVRPVEVQVVPVAYAGKEVESEERGLAEHRQRSALGVGVDGVGLDVGDVGQQRVQQVHRLPHPARDEVREQRECSCRTPVGTPEPRTRKRAGSRIPGRERGGTSASSAGSLPECWLLAEWPPGTAEPTDYWLSTLPADTPLCELVRIAKIRWRIEHDYRELKDGLGLNHFKGRTYLGWHRHVTLAALAQAFCTLLRLDPKAPAPA